MAIKYQCMNCKHNISLDFCAIKGINLIIDGISCSEYEKQGADLTEFNQGATTLSTSDVNENLYSSKKKMFQHPFSFKGRIRRTECCLSYLFYFIYYYFIYYFPMQVMNENEINEYFSIILLMLLIPGYWFFLAQGAKRCHDRGNSGWMQIVPFYFLWLMFAKGEKDVNDYGEPPK